MLPLLLLLSACINIECVEDVAEESAKTTWHPDADNDGYGDANVWWSTKACDQPAGYVADGTDCNDEDAAVNPDGTEVCDGEDNDCNGYADERVWPDADGDGVPPCLDCNDEDADVGGPTNWYEDSDGDGYVKPTNGVVDCTQPEEGWAEMAEEDCSEGDPAIHPGAEEVCNEVDDDCDGSIDEGTPQLFWHIDADDDGHGEDDSDVLACRAPEGYVADATDCDDTDATVYSGAPELCDGLDNNCDGTVDEGVWPDADADGVPTCTDCDDADPDVGGPRTWYEDGDGDGYVVPINGVESCTQPDGWAVMAEEADCSEHNEEVYPGAEELCDGIDNDCDWVVDEDCE